MLNAVCYFEGVWRNTSDKFHGGVFNYFELWQGCLNSKATTVPYQSIIQAMKGWTMILSAGLPGVLHNKRISYIKCSLSCKSVLPDLGF